jgi:hypothetical protein
MPWVVVVVVVVVVVNFNYSGESELAGIYIVDSITSTGINETKQNIDVTYFPKSIPRTNLCRYLKFFSILLKF